MGVLKVKLTVDSTSMKRIKTIPAYNRLFWPNQIKEMQLGENHLFVNNIVYSKLKRFFSENIVKE